MEYLQDYSLHFKLEEITEYNTSVENLTELPNQSGWNVLTKSAVFLEDDKVEIEWKEEVNKRLDGGESCFCLTFILFYRVLTLLWLLPAIIMHNISQTFQDYQNGEIDGQKT